jgi:hypothetical protein
MVPSRALLLFLLPLLAGAARAAPFIQSISPSQGSLAGGTVGGPRLRPALPQADPRHGRDSDACSNIAGGPPAPSGRPRKKAAMPRAAGAHNRGQRLLGGPLRGQESGLRRLHLPRHGAPEQRHDGGAAVAAAPSLCSTRAARPRRSVHLQITCETGPAEFPASLSVAVVDGSDVATFCCFAYTREHTPSTRSSSITLRRRRPVGRTARLHLTCTARRRHPPAAALQYVYPTAGPPGSSPALYGSASWTLQSQCSSLQGGDGQGGCVGSVLLGDYLCRTSDASSFQVGARGTAGCAEDALAARGEASARCRPG